MTTQLTKLRQIISDQKVDAVLLTDVYNILFLTDYDNFSKEEREAYAVVTDEKQYIITDARYTEEVTKRVPDFEVIERSAALPTKKILQQIKRRHNIKTLGIEGYNLTYNESKTLAKIIALKSVDLTSLRIEKSDQEIEAIKKACELSDKLFDYTISQIKTGMTEKEIAWIMEKFTREHGATFSFDPIVAFNANAAMPHYQTGDIKLSDNDLILIDFGVKVDNYCSDTTRVIFNGQPTPKQKKIYRIVLKSQQLAVNFIKNQLKKHKDINASDVDKVSRDYITSQGYPSIPHSLGHGIGLEVHESPSLSPASKNLLTESMVFSIEPGIYLPNNLGIRIEDLYAIRNHKLIQLTNASKLS